MRSNFRERVIILAAKFWTFCNFLKWDYDENFLLSFRIFSRSVKSIRQQNTMHLNLERQKRDKSGNSQPQTAKNLSAITRTALEKPAIIL